MRLLNFLTEDINHLISTIEKDCKYYLSLLKGKEPFYRGMNMISPFGKKAVRQDRKPRGMGREVAYKFNYWLKNNKHTTRNNSVIATRNYDACLNFGSGDVYYIYPIGKFNYTYIESMDVNIYDRETGWDNAIFMFLTGENLNDINTPSANRYMNKPFPEYFHTNKNINIAYDKEYEIWFDCKEYYYIKTDLKSFNYKDII